jgi:hypothetical protein
MKPSGDGSGPGSSRPSARVPLPESPPPRDEPASRRPKLLVRVREAIRSLHYSPRTEQAYVRWIKKYIFFHKMRHPAEMGAQWGGFSRTWPSRRT